MVTAEVAVLLPALVLLLVLAVRGVAIGLASLECVDAARAGARAASRGESRAVVERTALAVAPRGAVVELAFHGDRVVVLVRSRPALLAGLRVLLQGRAEAALEEGVGP